MERKRKVLSIGINYSGTDIELRGCVNDSKNVIKLLNERYPEKNFEVKQLLDKDASYDGILSAFDWLLEGMEPGDKMIFHYSGHGCQNGNKSDNECLVPNDYVKSEIISNDVIKERLINKVPARASLHVLMDCWHIKPIGDLKFGYEFLHGFNTINSDSKLSPTKGNIVMISGIINSNSSADTHIHDIMDKQNEPQGAITHVFINTYCGKRPTYTKLITTMREMLSRRGCSQIIQLTSGKRLCVRDRFELL